MQVVDCLHLQGIGSIGDCVDRLHGERPRLAEELPLRVERTDLLGQGLAPVAQVVQDIRQNGAIQLGGVLAILLEKLLWIHPAILKLKPTGRDNKMFKGTSDDVASAVRTIRNATGPPACRSGRQP